MSPLVGSGLWFGSGLRKFFAFLTNNGSNTVQPFAYNPTTGALTAGTAVATGSIPTGVAVDSTNHVVFVANEASATIQSYTYNPSTGVMTNVGTVATGSNPTGVAVAY